MMTTMETALSVAIEAIRRRLAAALHRSSGLCVLATLCAVGFFLPLDADAAGDAGRRVRIVVPYADGGPTAKLVHALAPSFSRALGEPVDVVFRGGEGATKGTREVFESGGDNGYTLLLHNIGMASGPLLYQHLPYDPVRDFLPIGQIGDAPMLLLGRKGLPVQSATELWAYIRRHQKDLTVAYGGPGGAGQLCGLLLERALQVKLFWVPFKGTGPALADLAKGRSDLLCDQTTHTLAAVADGRVQAFALATDRRLKVAPGIPTTAERGMPDLKITVWHGLYAVRGTAPERVAALSRALQIAVASPEYIAMTRSAGVVAATARQATPQSLATLLLDEMSRWKPLVVATGQYAD